MKPSVLTIVLRHQSEQDTEFSIVRAPFSDYFRFEKALLARMTWSYFTRTTTWDPRFLSPSRTAFSLDQLQLSSSETPDPNTFTFPRAAGRERRSVSG